MKAKEEWINRTIESIDDIQPAEPIPFLYQKIQARMPGNGGNVVLISTKMIWRVAACVALLAILNVLSVIHFHKSSMANSQSHSNPVANEYFSFMNTLQF